MDIHTDGSGKTGRYAYVVKQTRKVRISQIRGITNNESEYLAILSALRDVKENDITIHSDSQLVVNQLNKNYAIKEDRLRNLAEKIWKLCEGRNVQFNWIPREKNLAGKVLG